LTIFVTSWKLGPNNFKSYLPIGFVLTASQYHIYHSTRIKVIKWYQDMLPGISLILLIQYLTIFL